MKTVVSVGPQVASTLVILLDSLSPFVTVVAVVQMDDFEMLYSLLQINPNTRPGSAR